MSRFLTTAAMVALGIFLLTSCGNSPVQHTVKHKIRQQETTGSCWLASLRMIVETYKNVEVKECTLYNEINNFYGGGMAAYDCCAKPTLEPDLQALVCGRGGMLPEIYALMDLVLELDYKQFSRALTWEEVKSSIDNGFLIMSLMSHPLYGSAHAHIISGYVERDGKHFLVISETTLGMVIELEYEKYLGTGRSVWEMSFVFTMEKSPTPSCNMVFGDLICVKNTKTPNLIDRIKAFFDL